MRQVVLDSTLGTTRNEELREMRVSPRGLEPLTFGSGGNGSIFVSHLRDHELREHLQPQVPVLVPSIQSSSEVDHCDDELALIIGAWRSLPSEIRKALRLIVEAHVGGSAIREEQ